MDNLHQAQHRTAGSPSHLQGQPHLDPLDQLISTKQDVAHLGIRALETLAPILFQRSRHFLNDTVRSTYMISFHEPGP
jgi:hypothetical protein